ncbi:MAG: DUF523 domain-containing protein [Gammaproteobacteria bacterium]|nr:MAG: DUF523 domain-containing protein [Gammaproteobacteria bacterium]UCH40167.1 MAG: DUF523 domain-containing protein [Gammaproteobacteria bacterium]
MKILVSACLLGNPVRYDGKAKTLAHAELEKLAADGRAVCFCPEVAGGLPVPRKAAEIIAGNGDEVISGKASVKTRDGDDVTEFFLSGARQALELCRQHDIGVAILTESSPSCGSGEIYDGSFTRNPVTGSGVTAALLRQQGIVVYNQFQVDEALALLQTADDFA